MNKFTSAVASLALIGSAFAGSTALAQTGTYTGTADVFKGIPLNCTVSADFSSVPGKVVLNIGPPEAMCAALSIISNPHDYNVTGSALTVYGVNVNTITGGGCLDDLNATYDSTNDNISINDELDERDGGGNCTIESNDPLEN